MIDLPENPPAAETGGEPVARPRPTQDELRSLVEGLKAPEAAALLEGVDLDAETDPAFLYISGVCLGLVGRWAPAIDLLKRAASGGFDRFWCAFHLGQFEIGAGHGVNAAYYLTVALIFAPRRTELHPLLSRVARNVRLASLPGVEGGPLDRAASNKTFDHGTLALGSGDPGTAVCYFTAALACDATNEEARSRLLELAPDVSLAVLDGIDRAAAIAEVQRKLSQPGFVPLHELAAISVLDRLRETQRSAIAEVDLAGAAAANPVEVALRQEILYLPALHLQVWRDRYIPLEANTDPSALQDLKRWIDDGIASESARLDDLQEVSADVCILSNIYSHNFFHYLEELYKVVVLESVGFTGSYVLAHSSGAPRQLAILSEGLPGFSQPLLNLLGIDERRILYCDRPTRFRSAWLTTRLAHIGIHKYKQCFLRLREALLAAACSRASGVAPRLWLQRGGFRIVVNQEEVNECLQRYDFTLIDMAELPVAQQIAAAHGAAVIGGPHGAGMVHSMFMKERSAVVECFSPMYIYPCFTDICLNLGHRYFQIVGYHIETAPYQYYLNVHIDIGQLELALRNACE